MVGQKDSVCAVWTFKMRKEEVAARMWESSCCRRKMPDAKVVPRSLFSAEMHRRVRVNGDRSRVPSNYVRCQHELWMGDNKRLLSFHPSSFVKHTAALLRDFSTVSFKGLKDETRRLHA